MVRTAARREKPGQDPDRAGVAPSLTAAGGIVAVTELSERLGVIAALDAGMGPASSAAAGSLAGRCWPGWPRRSWPGRTSGGPGQGPRRSGRAAAGPGAGPGHLDRGRDRPPVHRQALAGREAGLAAATARMVSLLPAERAAELAEGPVTIDVDATDVEVYGSKKRGVAYDYQGQRAGAARGLWAETEIPLAADLLFGDQDPRSHVVSLLNRALAALPQAVRDGAAAAGRKIALRADAGYFAGSWPGRRQGGHGVRDRRQADPQYVEGAGLDIRRRLAGRRRHGRRAGRGLPVPAGGLAAGHGAADPPGRLDPDQVSATPGRGAAAPCTPSSGPCRSPNWSRPVIYA